MNNQFQTNNDNSIENTEGGQPYTTSFSHSRMKEIFLNNDRKLYKKQLKESDFDVLDETNLNMQEGSNNNEKPCQKQNIVKNNTNEHFNKEIKNSLQSMQERQSIVKINKELEARLRKQTTQLKQVPNKLCNMFDFKKINALKFVQQFVKKMLLNINKRRFNSLNKEHFQLIGDIICAEEDLNRENLTELSNQKKIQFFRPDNIFIIIWEFIYTLVNIILFLLCPMKVVLHINLKPIYWTSSICITINMILSINTQVYNSYYQLISSRAGILRKYLKGKFIFDLIYFLVLFADCNYLSLIFLCSGYLVKKQLYQLDMILHYKQKYSVQWKIIVLIFNMCILAHYSACVFIFIAKTNENDEQNSWITKIGLEFSDWECIYINALYYMFITMITVGYGDIVPVNIKEKTFIIFITIISSIVVGYCISTVGQIFQEIDKKNQEYTKQKYNIIRYMETRHISKDVENQVLKQLELRHLEENNLIGIFLGGDVLKNIPIKLVEEIKLQFFGRIIKQSKFFLQFSKSFQKKIALQMQEIVLRPGDILFQKGAEDNRLYYLISGKLQFMIHMGQEGKRKKQLVEINENSFFGYNSLLNEETKKYSAESLSTVHLAYIEKENFINLLKLRPEDYESYCLIRDQAQFQTGSNNEECFICHQVGDHELVNCPLITSSFHRTLIFHRNAYNFIQSRSNMQRKDRKHFYCLPNFKKLNAIARNLKLQVLQEICTKQELGQILSVISQDAIQTYSDKQFQLQTGAIITTSNQNGDKIFQFNNTQDLLELDILYGEECDSKTVNLCISNPSFKFHTGVSVSSGQINPNSGTIPEDKQNSLQNQNSEFKPQSLNVTDKHSSSNGKEDTSGQSANTMLLQPSINNHIDFQDSQAQNDIELPLNQKISSLAQIEEVQSQNQKGTQVKIHYADDTKKQVQYSENILQVTENLLPGFHQNISRLKLGDHQTPKSNLNWNQNAQQSNNQFNVIVIDRLCNFKLFYPRSNCENILTKIRKKQLLFIQEQKKSQPTQRKQHKNLRKNIFVKLNN